MGTEDSVNSAYAAAQKYVDDDKGWSFEPSDDEVKCVLEVIKNVRQHTRDYFDSILNNQGTGIFQPEKGRPFNRNLLFTTNVAGVITKIYTPDWLKEIKWCNPAIWTAANNDPEVGDLRTFIFGFKREWENFFRALFNRFPDKAADPLADFETAGFEMFGGLEASITCAKAKTPNADANHDCFISLLPKIKKLFLNEHPEKSTRDSVPTFESVVAKLRQNDKDSIARQWLEIRDVLQRYGLSIPLEQWETPTDWKSDNVNVAFGTLREKIESSIRLISNPDDNCFNGPEWEFLIPPILSFDLSQIWYTVPETLDDGFYHSEKLPSGDVINVSRISDNSYLGYQPLDMSICELERYIRLGNDIATQIDSSSRRNWIKADTIFREIRFEIPYSNGREKLEKLAGLLSEAKRDLLVDEKLFSEQGGKTAAEHFANQLADKLSEQPIQARVVEVDKSAGKSLRAAMKDPGEAAGTSPVKIGKGFPFITYCGPKGNVLRMKVKRDNGAEDELTFRINGEERWHYVLQFVRAKTKRVTLTPFEEGKPIDLSLVFRNNKGCDHRLFYLYTRTTKGSKAKYWLEQKPLRKRTK